MSRDVDPRLTRALDELGDEFGPLGVALAAAHRTDASVLIDRLRRPTEERSVPYAVPNPLTGYRELNEAELALVERVKQVERDVLGDLWRQVRDADTTDRADDPTFSQHESGVEVDRRQLAIARTHFQEGMAALIRSVTRPAEVYDT